MKYHVLRGVADVYSQTVMFQMHTIKQYKTTPMLCRYVGTSSYEQKILRTHFVQALLKHLRCLSVLNIYIYIYTYINIYIYAYLNIYIYIYSYINIYIYTYIRVIVTSVCWKFLEVYGRKFANPLDVANFCLPTLAT